MNIRVKLIALLGCLFTFNQALAVPSYSVDQNPMPGAKVTKTYNHNSGGWGITSYYGYYVTEFPSLNDFGFIAGRTDVANSPHPLIKGRTSGQAAVWEYGVTKNITFFNSCRDINNDGIPDASACGSRALAINNLGYVGGSSNTNKPAVDNYFERSRAWWPGNTGEYDVPTIDRPLSTYTPSQSQIEDINHQSNVVGTGITPGGAGPQDGLAHGLVSIDGDQDYIGITGQQSRAHALNENNLVTGAILWNDTDDYLSDEPNSLKAYTWLDGKLNVVQDDITDSSHVSEGFDVNDSNLVVGLMGWRDNTRAFKWDSPNGSLEDLGTLGGAQSTARSVNNAGTIVGWANTSDGAKHAFVYKNGTMYDLNDYASGDSGLVIVDAYSINEVGQILVRASNPSETQNQYWLLTDPDVEPFALPEPRPAVVEAVSMGVFGGENDEIPLKIMADAEGNTISIGYFNANYLNSKASTIDFDSSLGEDIQNISSGLYIQKLGANGNYLWTKTLPASLGISSSTKITDLFVEPDGSFHIVGWVNKQGNIDINPDLNAQEFLIKSPWDSYVSFRASYSSHGYLISSVRLPQFYRMPAVSIAVDSDKNIYVAYVKDKYSYDLDFDPGTGVAKVQLEQGRSAIVVTKTSRNSSGVERLEWAKSMSSIGLYNEQTRRYEDNYARISDVSIAAPAIAGEGPMLAFTFKGALNFQAYDSNLGLLGNPQIVDTEGVFRFGFIRMSESEYPGALWMAPEDKKASELTKVKLVRSGNYFGLLMATGVRNTSQLIHGISANAGINHISRTLRGHSKDVGINQLGDVYISGYVPVPVNFNPEGYDLQDRLSSYVTKINADGNYDWTFSHRGIGGINGYTPIAVDRFENVTLMTDLALGSQELLDHNGDTLPLYGFSDAVIIRLSPTAGSTTGTPSINPTDIISTEVTLSQDVIAGGMATYIVTVASLGNTTEQVNLSLDSLDAGITATFAETSLTPPVGGSITTTLTVIADTNVTDDSYPIRILVADEADQLYSSIVVTLKILRPDLDVSISPSIQKIDPGDSTTYDLVFTSIDGFSSTLDISAVSPHASITMSMSPAQVVLQPNGTAVATLTVNTDTATPTKLYYLKITATGGEYTQSINAQLYFRDTDLVLTEISTSDNQVYAGANIDLKLTVYNGGDFYVRPNTSIYLSRDATITTEDIRISSINLRLYGGSSNTWEPYRGAYIPSNLTGTYYLGAIVDPENRFVESNEDNNVLVASTTLEIKAKEIDLFISSVSIQDSQAYASSRIWVEYTIGNQGGTPVSARRFSMGAYLSRDASITTEDRRVNNLFKYDLGGDESRNRGSWIDIPSNMDSGIYYLGVIIDDRNQQEESNEDNNVGVASTTLQIGDVAVVVDDVIVSIAKESQWRYLDDGSDQNTAWKESTFDDSTWLLGNAQFGYGDGDETTVIDFGGNLSDKFITTYLRHEFNVSNADSIKALTLELLRDDGAVVYLNGTEIVRSNMPQTIIDFQTLASSAVGGPSEKVFNQFNIDSALLLEGGNVIAVEIHQANKSSSDISFDLSLTAYTQINEPSESISIAKESQWRYLDDGSDQNTAWKESTFDDSTWLLGDAQFGYGDGDETTVIDFGGNSSNKFITTYLRHEFNVSNADNIEALTLELLRDDGAVVYLNGTEVVRSNMPQTVIDFQTLASSPVGGSRERVFNQFNIDPALLLEGENVIAVEIHQANKSSSDISFDLSLTTHTQ